MSEIIKKNLSEIIDLIKKKDIKSEELAKAKEEIKSYGGEFKTFPQIVIEMKDTKSSLKYIGGYSEFEEFTRPYYDFEKLAHITRVVTNNLNGVS